MADADDTRDWAANCNEKGQERELRDGGDSGVVMMAAAAEHGGDGQQWQRWATTAMADDNSGGQQRQQMTTACKIEWRATRRKEEGRWQTTTALSQLGR